MSRIRQRTARCTPALVATAAALVGLINVASALTPNIRWRGRLLLDVEPVQAMRLFHAFALPAGAALLLVSPYLLKRRRRAWQVAIALMLALGLLDLLKGLDVEETLLTWAAAAMLFADAIEFRVEHDPITLRSSVWRVPLLGAFGLGLTALAAWVSGGRPSWSAVARETGDLLTWRSGGPLHFERHAIAHHAFAWVPLGVHLVEIDAPLAIAYVVFGPWRRARSLRAAARWRRRRRAVRAHGSDTLSFFSCALTSTTYSAPTAPRCRLSGGERRDAARPAIPWSRRGRTGAAGRPRELAAALWSQARRDRRQRAARALWEELGLRTMYPGDEAIIELRASLRAGRSGRCASPSAACARPASPRAAPGLRRSAVAVEAEEVLSGGREGAPERGFSMAMDSLHGDHGEDTLVVLARDEHGAVRGVLHFVPCYGRSAMSLSFMRRDPRTPNGLTEFMVVSAVELLRERGVDEMSLNFAAFARWMHSPERPAERALGKLIAAGNPFFQIESLYRFNAKFFPRWEPRYLVYQGALGLPRASVAAMWAENPSRNCRAQLPPGARPMARAR
jgi:lysyl-tRNA synthetase class 2